MPGPSDLHDRSAGAVAARRAHWRKRAEKPARRASTSDASRRSSSTGLGSHVRSIARDPRGYVRSRKAENKVGLAALLFFALVGIAAVRRGSWPDAAGFGSIGVGTLVVVAASLLAPDVTVMVLFVALLILAITNAKVIVGLAETVGRPLARTVAA